LGEPEGVDGGVASKDRVGLERIIGFVRATQ